MSELASQTATPKHYPALDGLRGIAVLLVFAHHFVALATRQDGALGIISQIGSSLWIGVDLFFVLSGFLITNILIVAKGSSHYFTTFYARRILRIFPLYYAVLGVLLILPMEWGNTGFGRISAYLLTYTINWHPGLQIDHNFTHLWTLAIEEQFYFIWPLLVWLIPRHRLPHAVFSMLIAVVLSRVAIVHSHQTVFFLASNTVSRSDGLLVGALLAVLPECYQRWFHRNAQRLALPVVLVTGSFILVGSLKLLGYSFDIMAWSAPEAYCMFSIIAAVWGMVILQAVSATPNLLQRLLELPLPRWLGKYSYGMYILHVPIMYAILQILPEDTLRSTFAGVLFLIFLLTTSSTLAAWLSWHAFEKHFLRFKRHFSYQLAIDVHTSPAGAYSAYSE